MRHFFIDYKREINDHRSLWKNMNESTKKLKKLVKQRKIKIVVTEQGSIKRYSKPSRSSSSSDYYSSSLQN
jgi:hypothetical protein